MIDLINQRSKYQLRYLFDYISTFDKNTTKWQSFLINKELIICLLRSKIIISNPSIRWILAREFHNKSDYILTLDMKSQQNFIEFINNSPSNMSTKKFAQHYYDNFYLPTLKNELLNNDLAWH